MQSISFYCFEVNGCSSKVHKKDFSYRTRMWEREGKRVEIISNDTPVDNYQLCLPNIRDICTRLSILRKKERKSERESRVQMWIRTKRKTKVLCPLSKIVIDVLFNNADGPFFDQTSLLKAILFCSAIERVHSIVYFIYLCSNQYRRIWRRFNRSCLKKKHQCRLCRTTISFHRDSWIKDKQH